MNIKDFIEKYQSLKFRHKWKVINGDYNYICEKCNMKSFLAWNASTCISDEEAIIKKLLE